VYSIAKSEFFLLQSLKTTGWWSKGW